MNLEELAINLAKKFAKRELGEFYVLDMKHNWLVVEDANQTIQFIWCGVKDIEDFLTPPTRHEAEMFAANWIGNHTELVDEFQCFCFKFAISMLFPNSAEIGKAAIMWVDPTDVWPEKC